MLRSLELQRTPPPTPEQFSGYTVDVFHCAREDMFMQLEKVGVHQLFSNDIP